jgi:hypothetical protein
MVDETPAPPAGTQPPQKKIGTSGSIYGLRGIASVMLILAFVIYLLTIADTDKSTYIIGLALAGAGVGIGVAGIWIGNVPLSKKMERTTINMLFLGISLILVSFGIVLAGTRIITTETIPILEIVLVLLFGFFMMSYIELSHASYRFADIDYYARTHELKGFNVGTVVNNYFTWFGILMSIILVLGFLILATHYGLILMITSTNEVFGRSVELNSIYVFAISIALWFIPLGIFASIIFGEGSLIKSTKTIFIKAEKAPGEELLGLQTIDRPEDMAKK